MATLKFKEMQKMEDKERQKKLGELKMELVKAKVQSSKSGTSKIREIRKAIARIETFNTSKSKEIKKPAKGMLNKK